jgi:Zn-finger nucleic acid-binding protein
MICPRCKSELAEVVKHGVVIDTCTSCGGIWLDKGEMSKIISQMKQAEAALDEEFRPLQKERTEYYDKYKHKKKSKFENLFDIFD